MTTMAKPMPKPDDPEQSKRFIEMATELEADGDEETFGRAVRKVATAKREPAATKTQTKRKKR